MKNSAVAVVTVSERDAMHTSKTQRAAYIDSILKHFRLFQKILFNFLLKCITMHKHACDVVVEFGQTLIF